MGAAVSARQIRCRFGNIDHNQVVTDVETTLAAVGPRLRDLRLASALTLAGLSETTGISVSTLSRLESGERRPTLELLLRLARVHRLSLDELVDTSVAALSEALADKTTPVSVVREAADRLAFGAVLGRIGDAAAACAAAARGLRSPDEVVRLNCAYVK